MPPGTDTTIEEYAATIGFPLAWVVCLLLFVATKYVHESGSAVTTATADANLNLAYVPVMAIAGWLMHLVAVFVSRLFMRRLPVVAVMASSAVAGACSLGIMALTAPILDSVYGPVRSAPPALIVAVAFGECLVLTILVRFAAGRIPRALIQPSSD